MREILVVIDSQESQNFELNRFLPSRRVLDYNEQNEG